MYDVAQQQEIMLDGIGDLEDVCDEAFLQEMQKSRLSRMSQAECVVRANRRRIAGDRDRAVAEARPCLALLEANDFFGRSRRC